MVETKAILKFMRDHPYISGAIAVTATQFLSKQLKTFKYKYLNRKLVLELDLSSPQMFTDFPLNKGWMADLMEENKNRVHYRDIVEAIEMAAEDSRVYAIIARVGTFEGTVRYGHAQEIREAIVKFSKKKLSIAYSEAFGEMGNMLTGYYLASAFKEIHMFPSGLFDFTGMMIEKTFLKGTLEKLEITANPKKRVEYKSALDALSHEKMTEHDREQTQKIMTDITSEIIKQIAASRGKTLEEVTNWLNQGFMSADEALENGVVTNLSYRDQVYESISKKLGLKSADKLNLLFMKTYYKKEGERHPKSLLPWRKEVISVLYANGPILHGTQGSQRRPKTSYQNIFGHDLARRIRACTLNKNVKVIIIRVNSPGGSGAGSDAVNREIHRAQQKGVKVVVSMGNVAASGGYWISMSADKIVCNGLGITGSIGVVGGKLVFRNFWKKLGITFDDVSSHRFSRIWSTNYPWNEEEDQEIDKLFDLMYEDFKTKVAKGRKLPKETVDDIARGHVYTGAHAKEIGLVDEVGGLSKAIDVAKELIGYKPDQRVKVETFPRPKPMTNIISLFMNKDVQNSHDQDKAAQSNNQTFANAFAGASGPFGFMFNQFNRIGSFFGMDLRALFTLATDPYSAHRQVMLRQNQAPALVYSPVASAFADSY